MGYYTYYDPKNKERFTLTMSIADMEEYEADHPHLERVFDTMNVIDPTGAGISRPPADFQKFVLGKVKANHPKGSVEKRWTIPKEV